MTGYNTKYVAEMEEARQEIRLQMNKFDDINKLFKVRSGRSYKKVLALRQRKSVIGLIKLTVHTICHKKYINKFTWGDFLTLLTKKFCPQFAKVHETSIRQALLKYTAGTGSESAMNKPLDTEKIREVVNANKCVCGDRNRKTLLHQWYLVNKEMMTQLEFDEEWTVKSFVKRLYMFLFESFVTVAKTRGHSTIKDNGDVPNPPIIRRKKRRTDEGISREFEKYKDCVHKILIASPEVAEFIGEDPHNLIKFTLQAFRESEKYMTWCDIVGRVTHLAITSVERFRIVFQNVPATNTRIKMVGFKQHLAKIPNAIVKWLTIIRAIGRLRNSPTGENTVQMFYSSIVKTISKFLEIRAEQRKQGDFAKKNRDFEEESDATEENYADEDTDT